MNKALALLAALLPLDAVDASAAPACSSPAVVPAPIEGPLLPLRRVENYRVVLESCRSDTGATKLAIRVMRVDGEDLLLVVNPQTLDTSLERAACWTCAATTDEAQARTRFIRAVDQYATAPGKKLAPGAGWLANAGLTAGKGEGAFVTADLCPSLRPLDRSFLQSLEKPDAATPVALSVSGLWIERHADDFRWLRREQAEGRLAISFVNHSYHHPYRPGLPDGQNFLLVPDLKDRQSEIFDVERLLIANGETPSVFFRFPGLISDRPWMELLRENHLVPLGSDAWLALPQEARPGAIVLIHANGNEPFGLSRFQSLRQGKRLPQPFRPINEAP